MINGIACFAYSTKSGAFPGWIIRGLETLLTQGRVVDVSVKACSLDYIINLDAVREVPSED